MQTERVTMEIYGMGREGGGAVEVERALNRVKGVVHAYANLAMETAYIQYDPAIVQPADLAQAIESAGFGAGAPIRR